MTFVIYRAHALKAGTVKQAGTMTAMMLRRRRRMKSTWRSLSTEMSTYMTNLMKVFIIVNTY